MAAVSFQLPFTKDGQRGCKPLHKFSIILQFSKKCLANFQMHTSNVLTVRRKKSTSCFMISVNIVELKLSALGNCNRNQIVIIDDDRWKVLFVLAPPSSCRPGSLSKSTKLNGHFGNIYTFFAQIENVQFSIFNSITYFIDNSFLSMHVVLSTNYTE